MAYNNGFPLGYPQLYYPQQNVAQTPYNQPQTASNGIIWVQGEAGAKSYLVAPNNTVQLWDSEDQVIYLKSADASGMPSMKILDYKIREVNQPLAAPTVAQGGDLYATKEELKEFKNVFEKRLKSLTGKVEKYEQSALQFDEE